MEGQDRRPSRQVAARLDLPSRGMVLIQSTATGGVARVSCWGSLAFTHHQASLGRTLSRKMEGIHRRNDSKQLGRWALWREEGPWGHKNSCHF